MAEDDWDDTPAEEQEDDGGAESNGNGRRVVNRGVCEILPDSF